MLSLWNTRICTLLFSFIRFVVNVYSSCNLKGKARRVWEEFRMSESIFGDGIWFVMVDSNAMR